MKTKSIQEGYLQLDHRESPGIPEPIAIAAGLPASGGRGLFEAATITCSHCCRVMIVNPLRTRERGYCPKCDRYVCDVCNAERVKTGVCKTFQQVIEETQEAAIRGGILGG